MTIKTIREVLAETIAAEMRTDPDVFLMGEDVSGGAGCDGRGVRGGGDGRRGLRTDEEPRAGLGGEQRRDAQAVRRRAAAGAP